MKIEFEKKLHIASDLLSYCHLNGATDLHLDINENKDFTEFVIKGAPVAITEHQMDTLKKNLNAPRQHEIEQDYWALMGESEAFSELTLVGMMSDEAAVELDDGKLVFVIKRYS